jgi:hypothetical protein
MAKKHLNPAEYAILVFGGASVIAREIGKTRGAVNRWKGYGGVPRSSHRKLLEIAKRKKIDFTAQDLITGRTLIK